MKEFMKGGDIHLNKTQSFMLLAGVIVIAFLSFLLGFLTNQSDKGLLITTKKEETYKAISSPVVSNDKKDMDTNEEQPEVDEKSDIKDTELTFYKTLANSPETKNVQQQENIIISKKTETVETKTAAKTTESKSQKKQVMEVEAVQKELKVPLVTEEDEAVEVDSKFGHLNVPANNKKSVETGLRPASTDADFPKEETIPKIDADAGLKPLSDDANLANIQTPEKKNVSNLYTVQVASFTSNDEAFNLKNKLEKKGFDSYIMLFSKDGVKWFRVRVGSLNKKEDAVRISKKIKDDIKMNTFVTAYER